VILVWFISAVGKA